MPRFKKSKDKKQDKRIASLQRQIGKPEIKMNEANIIGNTACAITCTHRLISSIAQNATPYGRDGTKVSPIGIHVDWTFQNTDTLNVHTARLILYRLLDDTPPSDANIFEIGAANTAGNLDIAKFVTFSKWGYHQQGTMEILYDSGQIPLAPNNNALSISDTFQKRFHFWKKVNRKKTINFTGTGATSGNRGDILLLTFADAITVVERGSTNIYYTDS